MLGACMRATLTSWGRLPSVRRATIDGVLAVLSFVVSIIALGVAIRLPIRSNRIAQQALDIAKRDEADRERQRDARATMGAEVTFVGREDQIRDGVLWQTGSGGSVVLALTVRNHGDRDAGRARIELTLPPTMDGSLIAWCAPSGHDLPGGADRPARTGDGSVLSRTLDGIACGVPEALYFRVPITVPNLGDVREYAISVRVVVADGADGETTIEHPLRIGRSSHG
jgi:ribosomal protein L35AE/L33A